MLEDVWRQYCDDLAPFSDLGTPPPTFDSFDQNPQIRFVRNGTVFSLEYTNNNQLILTCSDGDQRFVSFKSLLASDIFANLKLWARNQEVSLAAFSESNMIEMVARAEDGRREAPLKLMDTFFDHEKEEHGLSLVLFDGPAGIGKTTLLQNYVFNRAKNYSKFREPLILHLQSKGKMLQNIFDLIALNLQVIRSSVTFDQVPILVRHGLVTMVIDGFDELGDPNGYELAWAQLNDFLRSVRGEARIILSGRETFVSKDTMLRSLPIVTHDDRVLSLTILPTEPNVAKRWLRDRGWTDEALHDEQVADLLDDGSFALRPFFLKLLAEPGLPQKVIDGETDDLLSLLMNQLMEREATKFGEDTDRVVDVTTRTKFLTDLMIEVARDLAENQTDSITTTNLSWLSDVASVDLPEDVRGILRNRANVVAFLTEDIQPNRVRFFHESVYYYWLSQATFHTLLKGEVPKYIRRSILSSDFLDVWNIVAREKSPDDINKVFQFCASSANQFGSQDRTKRNFFSLSCALASVCDPASSVPQFLDITIEELIFRETSIPLLLHNVYISQLDIRGADISKVAFEDCQIHALIVDAATQVGAMFPRPTILVGEEGEQTDRNRIEQWLFEQNAPDFDFGEIFRSAISRVPELVLLQKIARFRRYWIKDDESDPVARKILNDPSWPILSEALLNLDYMVASNSVAASGRPSTFYHLRKREKFLNTVDPSSDLVAVMHEIIKVRRQ